MDFSINEYGSRQENARKLMIRNGLDAILVTQFSNYQYLTGHRTQQKEMGRPEIPFMCVLPKENAPVLIGPEYMEEAMKRESCVKDIRTYTRPYSVKQLKDIFQGIGLSGKIGAELGMPMEISYSDLSTLAKEIHGIQFVDAADLLWEIRKVKSETEIGYLRKVFEITSKAFEKLYSVVEKGMTEVQVAQSMYRFMMDEGADKPGYCLAHIYPGALKASEPTDRALKDGDYIFVDAGAIYKGYRSDFNRSGVVGKPDEKQNRMYEYIRNITLKCVDSAKPGVKLSELYKVYSDNEKSHDKMAKIGHNIGLNVVEPPLIARLENSLLEERMVITIEPSVLTGYGLFEMEEVLVATKNGCEVISTAGRELRVI